MKLTLGMIVKDEQYYLSKILPVIRGYFDELVAVDAESTDLTTHILNDHRAKIITRKWDNDYSKARNEVIINSSGDWILFLDADESMNCDDLSRLRVIVESGNSTIYEFPRLEFVGDYVHCDRMCYPDYQARVFKTGLGYHYRNNIHEILYKQGESRSCWENGLSFKIPDIHIYHYGQCRPSYEIQLKRYNYRRIKQGLSVSRHLPEGEPYTRTTGPEVYSSRHPLEGMSDAWITAADAAMRVDGWMSRRELQWLCEAATMVDTVIEVGCWKGRSTKALGECVKKRVIAIDHFKGSATSSQGALKEIAGGGSEFIYKTFCDNLSKEIMAGKVYAVISDSAKAPSVVEGMLGDEKPDMVFIDSDHRYKSVIEEIDRWSLLVANGGIICGHDHSTAWPDVMRAVGDRFGNKYTVHDTIWIARK